MRSRKPTYQLVTTGRGRPSDELLAEVAARTGIADIAGRRVSWLRRLTHWLLGSTPR